MKIILSDKPMKECVFPETVVAECCTCPAGAFYKSKSSTGGKYFDRPIILENIRQDINTIADKG